MLMPGVRNPMPGVVYPTQAALERYVTNGPLGEETLAEALMSALGRWPDRVAVSSPEGAITHGQLDHDSDCFAGALMEMGLKPLDRVVFQVFNSIELVVAIVACWKADLIPVCTLAAHRDAEISYLAGHSGARAHFIGIEERFDFAGFARGIAAKTPSMEHLVVIRGDGPDDIPDMTAMIASQDREAARARIEAIERDPYQVTVFQLSGGTTSIPKIIPRFSNEYLYNMQAFADWEYFDENTVTFMPLQVIHNAAMVCFVFPTLLRGGETIVTATVDPPTLFGLIQQRKPTYFGVIGTALSRMQQVGARNLLPLEQVKGVFSTNAARKTEEVLGVKGIPLFGMTEGLIAFGRPTDPEEARFTTIGRPISEWDEVRIVEPGTETDVAPGETGEMISRGPYTFCGYYDAEERNREVFTSDGFFRSGDLMAAREIEGETYYSFEGRLKDIVSRGGEKINCEEVEHASRRHPGVGDILIVAMPDPQYEERACAFVIPSGARAAPDVKGLMEFLVGEGLAKYKCPERIELIDEFPLTDSGKPSKPKLKTMIREKLRGEAAGASQ
ncbi:MAG: (2,3-dihydroxybenzoyl)adenylate synthase [Gammaproteobacteria bacterium]|nr:(2,3-dihydroxybenzoyl)adenylate synthase [Gammaproteobacteria bacterium]MYE28504.1 (2,3-dihydroxybenzoyl)adenylate synthase [Gammaproteobacteria bacterium]